MALIPYIGELDIYFPGAMHIARFIHYIDPTNWAVDLYQALGRYVWEGLQRAGQRFLDNQRLQLEHATRELAQRGAQTAAEALAQYFENARWAISNFNPQNLYRGLENYYRQLPPLNPIQRRQLDRRAGLPVPDRVLAIEDNVKSADYVERYAPPGGAFQRQTPDWMLPLILGLYGDINPSWGDTLTQLEKEDGPPSKKRKKTI
ncbi:VP3 [Panthera leo polyomavirus 1]|nr:VP3 [Panthera leo polyomavirus 1]AWD33766.1 VP3 [Panthera leo polyomavirus 1]AWD33777.1 VP3 [Panthera leo polyomavirus 1]